MTEPRRMEIIYETYGICEIYKFTDLVGGLALNEIGVAFRILN